MHHISNHYGLWYAESIHIAVDIESIDKFEPPILHLAYAVWVHLILTVCLTIWRVRLFMFFQDITQVIR